MEGRLVGLAAGFRADGHIAGQRDLKGKDLVPGLFAHRAAVGIQRDFFLVGVDLDDGGVFLAVGTAAAGDVDERLVAPPCFVEVESVLFGLAVKRHQALVVHAGLAALVAGVGGKVEHIPHMRRPQPGVAVKAAQHVLVVNGLVILGMVAAARVQAVQVGHRLGAVLAEAQRAVGVDEVEEIHPQIVEEEPRHIPAQVQVPADQVGDVGRAVERPAHGVAGQRRQAGGVQLVAQVVEHAVVVQHVGLVFGRDRDLVGDAPAHDAGVVVVLGDELGHLADGVVAAVRHVLADIGDLGPDDHAGFVAQVIEVLVVLVMRQADGVGADFLDERHVLVVHRPGDGVAQALAVLMAGDAVQRVAPTVEPETALGVDFEIAHAKAGAHFVHRLAVHRQGGDRRVEVGVLAAVPQVHSRDGQRHIGAAALGHRVAVGVQQLHGHAAVGGVVPGLDLDGAALVIGRRFGRHLDAGAAVVVQIKVVFVDDQQRDGAVDTAVERKVCFLRVDAVVFAVVHFHQQVVFGRQHVGDVGAERRVPAVMLADDLPVELHFGRSVDAVELQVDALRAGVIFRRGKFGLVGAGKALVVVAAVLAVLGVPGMRQGDGAGGLARHGKLPCLVHRDRSSHRTNNLISGRERPISLSLYPYHNLYTIYLQSLCRKWSIFYPMWRETSFTLSVFRPCNLCVLLCRYEKKRPFDKDALQSRTYFAVLGAVQAGAAAVCGSGNRIFRVKQPSSVPMVRLPPYLPTVCCTLFKPNPW